MLPTIAIKLKIIYMREIWVFLIGDPNMEIGFILNQLISDSITNKLKVIPSFLPAEIIMAFNKSSARNTCMQ
jgi:hypothetical protein